MKMTIQLDKWNKELETLSNRRYKKMDGVLYNYYKDTLRQLKFEVQDYLGHYDELSFSKRLEVENQLKMTRRIDEILVELSGKATQTITEYVTEELQQGYYGTWYALEGAENLQIDFGMLPERYIEQLVHKPVNRRVFSRRLYYHRTDLAERVTSALLDGAVRGVGYAKVAKQIGELTEANYKQSLRIARTEGGRVQSSAKQKSYEDAEAMGIKLEKQWMSTLDEKTRTSHQVIDGQRVKINEKFTVDGEQADGPRLFGVAGLDINCRCTTIPVVNDIVPEFRVDNTTGEHIKYTNYQDWADAKGIQI